MNKKASEKQWNKIGKRNHHGICVPLFSLHSKESCGIGEYLDLIPLIHWCRDIGLDVVQLLPLNDTAGRPSPYSAVSAFALNPIHLSLTALPDAIGSSTLAELRKLTARKLIDYERVWTLKQRYLRRYYKERYPAVALSGEYRDFIKSAYWLKDYADGDHFSAFVQYLCHCQMKAVSHAAKTSGILLKGDIPILLSRQSVDCKKHPDLFDFSLDAGAPPDDYAAKGQNWSFPLFDWDNNSSGIIDWWEKRLRHAARYFQLYRLDHVIGLFRIWGIPRGRPATEGAFVPPGPPERWDRDGCKRLKAFLRGCAMLPIAEDLGTVPPGLHATLRHLGIPGTKVMRWEHIPVSKYPKESMTTVSTHDTPTLWQWFHDEGYSGIKRYRKLLHLSHHSNSYFHINLLQEYFPLTQGMLWGVPKEERINDASKPLKRNWRYRHRPSVEMITADRQLADAIASLLR
ncbi:MAG: 4-alpha-glucanotransferase [Chlamydiales bacterium]|nr:4-alpha-glucanotransferase [Chlamydiia bacterium]MCP5506820.1 4-alpha-glucanotransferase [Chlamydiales bacterium]